MTEQFSWQNRIIGTGTEDPTKLMANPANWRTHPKFQQEALAGVLDKVGWVQQVIVNKRTGHLVDGHLRTSLAVERKEATIPVTYVDLDETEEALILATLDPLAALAGTDNEQLQALLTTISTEKQTSEIKDLVSKIIEDTQGIIVDPDQETENVYTTSTQSPIYTPTGEKPEVYTLVNTEKYRNLLKDIEDSDIPQEVKVFLSLGATRHIVFNYKLIAEYYAHASPEVQKLMEDSALVIIDFDRAIELGYVELTSWINQFVEAKRADEDD